MPAVYAHRRFGAEVLACCRNEAARAAFCGRARAAKFYFTEESGG